MAMNQQQLLMRAVSVAITNLRLDRSGELDRRTVGLLINVDNHLFELMMKQTTEELLIDSSDNDIHIMHREGLIEGSDANA